MAARIASGPGFWTEWLAELDRQGLLEELLAEDVIARALREAPTGHKYDRVLTAKMTVICVLVACLFPGAGYDTVLATAFGLPGLRLRPGAEIPSGSAFSQARKLLGEQVMQRLFELDAAVPDADLGIGLLWKGLEVTAIDGTTMELARNDVLDGEFGTPADGARPLLRVTAHVRTATFRWIGAAIGGYHDGENALADQLEGQLPARHAQPRRPRLLLHGPLAPVLRHRRPPGLARQERREIRPAQDPQDPARRLRAGHAARIGRHAHPAQARNRRPRARNGSRTPPPGSSPSPSPPRPAAAGRRPPVMRVLTTLLDHEAYPAREIAVLYAERWQIEIAFLHLKRTVRGPRRPLRGQSPELARQEAWALLLIHNITATAAARAAGSAGLDPGLIPFTAVLGLVRSHVAADACCRHCGHRPASAGAPLASLNAAILALPRHRPGRQRTSGRTTAERRTRHTEEVTYTIDITKSNLPKWDTTPET